MLLRYGVQRTEIFVISDGFLPFNPAPPSTSFLQQSQKSTFWKNEKKARRYYHFTHVCEKWQSYDVWFLTYRAQRTEFFVILDHFFPIYPLNNLKNKNFEKILKNAWRYYHFALVYHQWQSHNLWFLRYGARRTELFVILDQFLHF